MLAPLAVSLVAVAAFGVALFRSGVVAVARDAVSTAMTGLGAMTDGALDDDAKEIAVRRAAFALFRAAFALALRFALILAAAAIPILLADWLGLVSGEAVLGLMLRLDYILIVSVVALVAARWFARAPAAPARASDGYSEVDRFFHGLAFASPAVLRTASRIEDRLIGRTPTPERPIFVTSLARGGTTALLNALSRCPEIATHTYRDMPFVTAPILWNRLAGGRRRQVAERARAHGDGLTIGLDSPEAFEEVVWKMFWPEKYRSDGIDLWTQTDRRPEAEAFLARHMAKIARARARPRYCSKNNANIARLAYLTEAFPEARVVIPLRRPARHAASLLRQHQNFSKLQTEDPFVRRYMGDIGHYEFGLIHRPFRFPGFTPSAPDDPDYWLASWIHAFREVEARLGPSVTLVRQDSLRAAPQATMETLAERLELDVTGLDFTPEFLSAPDTGGEDAFSPEFLADAQALYDRLAARAL